MLSGGFVNLWTEQSLVKRLMAAFSLAIHPKRTSIFPSVPLILQH